MQAQRGYTSPYEVISLGVSICGRVGETGETSFVQDVRTDPGYRPAVDGVVSEICVPLRDGKQLAGILNVESTVPLGDLDRELLELFATQVSVVLRNARQAGELRIRAERDPLTDLANHRALMEELDRIMASSRGRCAVLMLDLNYFKLLNDTHGHLTGDACLRQVASILRENCRHEDLAGRYGGDEFMIILPRADRTLVGTVATRIATALHENPYRAPGGTVIPLAVSIGAAVAPDEGCTRQEILAVADAAMYGVKRAS